MKPWSDFEGAWADLGLYYPCVLEDMFVPITWLFPWILSVFLWTLYYYSLTFFFLHLPLLLWPPTTFPSFQMFIYTISKHLSWLWRLQASCQDRWLVPNLLSLTMKLRDFKSDGLGGFIGVTNTKGLGCRKRILSNKFHILIVVLVFNMYHYNYHDACMSVIIALQQINE